MREIRQSGSVRGVRRKPYPYRDLPKSDAVGSALLSVAQKPARRTQAAGFEEGESGEIAVSFSRYSSSFFTKALIRGSC